jgi:hypothetical protein
MASYKHIAYASLEESESYFDSTFNDTIYTRLRVYLTTTDLETGQKFRSFRWADLPPVTPQNYIPSNQIRDLVLESLVENNMDVIAAQDFNVATIQSIYDGTYSE